MSDIILTEQAAASTIPSAGKRTIFMKGDGALYSIDPAGAETALTYRKDGSGGVAGLTLLKLNLRNVANTVTSWFTTAATSARTWTMPDKDGVVAMTSDVTGTNSGTNTGDQTTITGNAGTATSLSAGADRIKLNSIAASATVNSADAVLLARANHTGTQAQSTVTGLVADLAAKAPAANPVFTGTVGGIAASMVSNSPAGDIAATNVQAALNELDAKKAIAANFTNVNNTSDVNKPVSTAQAAAIALRYGKNNVLGAVSQSAGVPTGAVIERGSNANGEYVRFADGTQICTNAYSGGLALSAYSGPISRGVYTWAYPAAFAGGSGPMLTGSGGDQTGNGFTGAGTVVAAQGELVYFTASPVVTASSICAMVIGRWF